jgi:hypothetical protein
MLNKADIEAIAQAANKAKQPESPHIVGAIKRIPKTDNRFMLQSDKGDFIIYLQDSEGFTSDTIGLLASGEVDVFPRLGRDGYVKQGTLRITI